MGGKTWSREEELYFWRIVVPQSPKAATEMAEPVEWAQLAADMQQHFGLNARRNYTSLMLCMCRGASSPWTDARLTRGGQMSTTFKT